MDSTGPLATEIDEPLRRRFEAAWRAGSRPQIEDHLPSQTNPTYLGTLVELIKIDLEMSWKAMSLQGSDSPKTVDMAALPRVERYLASFPSLNKPEIVLDLLREEYGIRHRLGDRPLPKEYCDRFKGLVITGDEITSTANPTIVGPQIPDFEIVSELGEGGMGRVYRARQISLNREVALKIILTGKNARPEELARFRIEAQAVAQLQHPNIVQIYQVGEAEGVPFLAMEFVPGESLAAKTLAGPVGTTVAAQWALTLTQTMAYVHEQGILHRDLKPANVMLRTDGVLKVTDFGLARRLTESTGQTLTGAVVGTPSYAAPELASGRNRGIGPTADIYAVGATLYEILTGRPPFRGESTAETLLQVLKDEPVTITRLRPGVPRDLETICHKCLQKEPSRRYLSATALADDLQNYLSGRPVTARPISTMGRLVRWVRRNPLLAGALATTTAALIAVAIVSTTLAIRQTRYARIIAEKQQQTQSALQFAKEGQTRAEALSASLVLDQSLSLCQQGDIKAGLLWLARSLTLAPQSASDLQSAIRLQMDCWGRQISYPLIPPIRFQAPLTAVALSRDGTLFLTGGSDHTAQLWDAGTGNPAAPAFKHGGPVRTVAISPDGRLALTASDDGTARLWNVPDGTPAGQPMRHSAAITCALLSPDGTLVATASADQTARLWRCKNGQPCCEPMPAGHVSAMCFSPDGTLLATAGRSQVTLWHMPTGKPLGSPLICRSAVHAVVINFDGSVLAAGWGQQQSGGVQLWDLPSAQPIAALDHPSRVTTLGFSRTANSLLTGCDDGNARWWNLRQKPPAVTLLAGAADYPVRCVSISNDGQRLAAGCADGAIRVWNAPTSQPVGTIVSHSQAITAMDFSNDGHVLLTGSEDQTARLWAIAAEQSVGIASDERAQGIASYDRNRQLCLSLGPNGDAKLIDVSTGKALGPPLLHDGTSDFERQVLCVALSPDASLACTGGRDHTVRLWNPRTGKPLLQPLVHEGSVTALALAPDGRSIFTGTEDRIVRRWNVATGSQLGPSISLRGAVTALAMSPDGRKLFTACTYQQDHATHGQGRIWDLETGQPTAAAMTHAEKISAAIFSPDSRVVIAADDQTTRFWDAASGTAIGPVLNNAAPVTSLEIDSAGLMVIAHGSVRQQWRIPRPLEGTPAQLQNWAEWITGLQLDASNLIHRLDDRDIAARRQSALSVASK